MMRVITLYDELTLLWPRRSIRRPEFFLDAGAANLEFTKVRSTRAHKWLIVSRISATSSTDRAVVAFCRADWVRNDPVLTTRGAIAGRLA
jgi:hypothetical protein